MQERDLTNFKDELLTIPETAKLLKVNSAVVCQLLDAGLLSCIKLGRKKIRYSSIIQLMDKYENFDITNPLEIKEI
ncbi:helix-turn-helix domain-containing protein [bacterium]|nr:helix-turn-helix domain-containing protein [bacterium]